MHSVIDSRLLTLSKGKAPVSEALGPGGIADRIPAIVRSPLLVNVVVGTDQLQKSAVEKSTPSSPSLFIFSVRGDPFRGERSLTEYGKPRMETNLLAEIAPLEEYLGLNSHAHCLFDTLRPYQNYFTDYDPSLMHREAISTQPLLPSVG
jgi:hypothetical protein